MITRTDAHRKAMIEEAARVVIDWQTMVARNAAIHRDRAVQQSVPLEELQAHINAMLAAYESSIRAPLRSFRDVTIPADPAFLTVGDQLALTLQSVGLLGTEIADRVDAFAAMPRTSYAEIIAACDYLIANVDEPERVITV